MTDRHSGKPTDCNVLRLTPVVTEDLMVMMNRLIILSSSKASKHCCLVSTLDFLDLILMWFTEI